MQQVELEVGAGSEPCSGPPWVGDCMRFARQRLFWAVAVLLLGLGWLLTPHPVPVYDGVGLPDQPYRYVVQPLSGKRTPRPTVGVAGGVLRNGVNADYINAVTGETGPQATVGLPSGAVAAPSDPVTVTLTPLAPTEQPAGARIDGNVYQVTITSPGGPVQLTKAAGTAAVYLRAPTQARGEVVQYRPGPGRPWRALETSQSGQDIWGAVLAGPGQYALAITPPAAQASAAAGPRAGADAAHSGGVPGWAVALSAAVLALILVVLLIRRRAAAIEPER